MHERFAEGWPPRAGEDVEAVPWLTGYRIND